MCSRINLERFCVRYVPIYIYVLRNSRLRVELTKVYLTTSFVETVILKNIKFTTYPSRMHVCTQVKIFKRCLMHKVAITCTCNEHFQHGIAIKYLHMLLLLKPKHVATSKLLFRRVVIQYISLVFDTGCWM